MSKKFTNSDTGPLFSRRLVLTALTLFLAFSACMPFAAAAVTSINPINGSVAGGTPVIITGTDFYLAGSPYTVMFGDLNSPLVTRLSDTTLRAYTPGQEAGVVDVAVFNATAMSQGSLPGAFTYNATAPADIYNVDVYALEHPVAGFEPTIAENLATDSLEYNITELYWEPAATAFEDGQVYTATITLMSNSTAGVKFPAAGIPQQFVHVNGNLMWGATASAGTTYGGDVSGNTLTFTVAYPETPIAGNITSAEVTGFVAPVTGATPQVFSTLTAVVTPASGDYDVTGLTWSPTVTTTYAGSTVYTAMVTLTSNATSGFRFPATGLTPTVNAGTPEAGTTNGGNVIGNTLAFNVTFPQTAAEALPFPTYTSLAPINGPAAGSTSVIITGTNLTGATSVTFGGTAGTITGNTATQITVTTPAHAAGTVDVVITTPNGTATGTSAYTYQAAPVCGMAPIVGDWDGSGNDTAGLYQRSTGMFFLKNSNAGGDADSIFQYGAGGDDWSPLVGDWDGNGSDTVGLYQTSIGVYFVKNSNGPGAADTFFPYGAGGDDWIHLSGDWNGDGNDTVGAYQKSIGYFFLKNSNDPGPADITFQYGAGGNDWAPIVGDWDHSGNDTVGLYQTSTGTFFLKNSNDAGPGDITFQYGAGGNDWVHLSGDWDSNGYDTVGAYQRSIGVYFLKNTNGPGDADTTFQFGPGCSS